jgi:hypothetical protein
MIFLMNLIFDTKEKLNWYIQSYHSEYYNKKRKYIKSDSSSCGSKIANKVGLSSKKKLKKKKRLYVDTSYNKKIKFVMNIHKKKYSPPKT